MSKREWWRLPEFSGLLGSKPNIPMSVMPPNNPMGIGPAPAGVVAAGEYVVGQEATSKIGAGNLDKMQEKALGRKMKHGGQQMPGMMASYGVVPAYGTMDDGGLVKKGPVMRRYGVGPVIYGNKESGWDPNDSKTPKPYTVGDKETGWDPNTPTITPGMKQEVLGKYRDSLGTPVITSGTPKYQRETGGGTEGGALGRSYLSTGVDLGQPATPGTTLSKTPTDVKSVLAKREELNRIQGMKGLSAIASGQSPVFRTLANMAQQQMATQGAMDQASLRQQMSQMGVTGGAANAMMADLQRDIGSQQAQIAGQTAVNAQQMAAQATGELAQQGLAGQQFAEGKRQFDMGMQQDAMNAALAAGDLDTYAKQYKDMYGTDLDVATLKDTKNAALFSRAMAGMQAVLQTNPNTAYTDSGAQMYLQDKWTATGHTGAMDQNWAKNEWSSAKLGSDPLYQQANSFTEEGATAMWGSDFVNNYKRTDANGNVTTGWQALKTDLGTMSITSGSHSG